MKHVFACVDGSASTTAVCDYASWAAQRLATPLTLLHVLDELRYPVNSDLTGTIGLGEQQQLLEQLAELEHQRNELALQHGRNMLEAGHRRAIENGVGEVFKSQRHGQLAQALAEVEASIRLLVVGLHGTDSNDSLRVGSQLETLIRSLQKPTLVTPKSFRAPRSVMLAFDGSDASRKGVKMLAESPIFKGMQITLVTVGQNSNEVVAAIEAAANHLREYRHQVDFEIITGEVQSALLDYQRKHHIDLIVMGAFRHSRARQWFLGSTTRKLLQAADVPLLLLR